MAVVRNSEKVSREAVENASKTYIQWLIDSRDNSNNIYLRKFTIAVGGEIPPHSHPEIEHVQYVLRGEYVVTLNGVEHRVRAGDAIYIPPNTVHSYRNTGSEDAEFLCIIPSKDYTTKWEKMAPRC